LGVSAAHLGVSTAISAFHLLTVAAVYGVSPAHAQDLLQRCSFGEISGDIVEQQLGVGDSWWSTALAYLPASRCVSPTGSPTANCSARPVAAALLAPRRRCTPASPPPWDSAAGACLATGASW